MYFVVKNDVAGHPYWELYGDNHLTVAWSGQSFASTYDAKRAAESFKAGAATAKFEVYLDSGGKWRWRAWRSSDKVAASGQHFYDKYDAERAAKNVQANAGGATGP